MKSVARRDVRRRRGVVRAGLGGDGSPPTSPHRSDERVRKSGGRVGASARPRRALIGAPARSPARGSERRNVS